MRARKSTDHFDLLPFIAILMCTLGTLLLVTLCMAAINMGPGAGEAWIPTNETNRVNRIPVLVEWDGEAATVHRADKRERIRLAFTRSIKIVDGQLKIEEPEDDRPRFESFLSEMALMTNTHYALFAVRPSGFKSFLSLRSEFEDKDISVGYEPIPQGKSVRLGNTAKPKP
jgi:hypothetical protein